MLAPISWLKEYINITLKPEELGDLLTEVGLGTEHIHHEKDDVIFELEITPNRPDWLSMVGVAREIAAIENEKIKYPDFKTNLKPKRGIKLLPLKIYPDFNSSERMTGVIISGIEVKESPKWLREKLESIGQRSINNIVDITNFVMWELGNPIHAFDYDKISNHEMWVRVSKGGEKFESVDGISYHLPKGAIIYEDNEKIFDLAGIKGGKNSGTYDETKNVFILVPVDNPVLIRKASQALSLRSDASAIFERAVNKGGTIDALKRTVDLVLETAGGEIASELIDLKEHEFTPWKLRLRLQRLDHLLGIKIPEKEVISLLERLNLDPLLNNQTITCTIPTYRNDLQIEEDLIEEAARLYGYNNFPKTMISGQIPTSRVPYFKDYRMDEKVKEYFLAIGFFETYSYSLSSENDLQMVEIDSQNCLRVDNPVSLDFEYLRPTLKINLLKALKQNLSNFSEINLFELGKVYIGKSLDKVEETYYLSGISNKKTYYEIKGILEEFFKKFGVKEDVTKYIEVLGEGIFFETPYSEILEKANPQIIYNPIPKYPPVTEDISLGFGKNVKVGEVIDEIYRQSSLIKDVSLLDMYEDTRTFHIIYQDSSKNLTVEEVSKIREKIISALSKKFSAKIK